MARLYLGSLMLALAVSGPALASNSQEASAASCGYSVTTGTDNQWNSGFQGWASVRNEAGETATRFELFLDIGAASVSDGFLGDYQPVDGGYLVTSPFWLIWQQIPVGSAYRTGFIGSGAYSGITPYMISVNGHRCDTEKPSVDISTSESFYTSAGNLSVTADADDNIGILKVVFKNNGVIIGEDYDAPYSIDVPISDSQNGRNQFTATAYDFSGNIADSDSDKVFVAIGNRFLGTAPGSAADFEDLTAYFNQLTPEDAGKWGSVEAERDVMNWDGLDTAYNFAMEQGIPFKLHTLVWGQQAPAWLEDLSADEQLAEIEEWFAALAERYPNVDMVDVVNEPLHAPAGYREALGGAGETGWDWVVKSFELARLYFPDAQLVLNDYQILILENFTNDYMAVVDVLQARGLIDGIGLQAHFLERAEIAAVASNLEIIASRGLPIYISELDVDFADDARQANRLRDLFTAFWDNPAVVGVTHWGHLQGDIWRSNAYLIRSDKSLRPSMEWLQCFYGGGTDCLVPDYIPAGWSGDAFGLTLEAELFDEQHGLAPLGSAVTYTDDGDWFGYYKVSFQSDWENLAVTYLKGNDSAATLSVHLDSLDSDPVAVINLTPTGGWGTSAVAEADLPAISGEHDVYFRFNGSYGAGNVDSIRIGKPDGLGPELVSNGDFENGNTNGWFTWDGSLQATMENVYEGSYALQLTNRSGNGPAAVSLLSSISTGSTYKVSMMASISGASSADVHVTQKFTCDGEDSYTWLINPVTISDGEWVELAAEMNVPDCDLTDALIFAEGPDGGIDIYLDNVSVRQVLSGEPINLLPGGDFESGDVSSWFSWDGTISATSALVYEGNFALELSGRSGNGPAATNITSLVTPGITYNASFAVTITGAASAPVNVTQKTVCNGEDASYDWVTNLGAVNEGEWSVMNGQIEVPDCDLTELLIYAEGPDGGINLYLDSVTILP